MKKKKMKQKTMSDILEGFFTPELLNFFGIETEKENTKEFGELVTSLLSHRKYRYPISNMGSPKCPLESFIFFGNNENIRMFVNQINECTKELALEIEKYSMPALLGRKKENDKLTEKKVIDFAKIGKLLISGTTGYGKTRSIYSTLLSLMYLNSMDALKIAVVDFKQDLFHFNEIVNYYDDYEKASDFLERIKNLMPKRQRIMGEVGALNIFEYNKKIIENKSGKIMPFIVVVVDEIADLFTDKKLKEAEENFTYITRKGRSSGIILIMSTQRPSIDSINSQVKANSVNNLAFKSRDSYSAKVAGVPESVDIKEVGLAYLDSGINSCYVQSPYLSTEVLESIIKKMLNCGYSFKFEF